MSCSTCGNENALASGKKYCKRCQANYQKKHYASKKWYYKEKARARDKRIREFITATKEGKKCTDCGVSYPSYVMDYDHKENKEHNVSQMAKKGLAEETILKEIAKCDLVCSNCHRERTYQRWLIS